MNQYMTSKEASAIWGISERRVGILCSQGRIDGAMKQGRIWLIPADAKKPTDLRFKTVDYKKRSSAERLPLSIGVSDYRLASTEYYYVDKTMMIKDFLDERPIVSLFTRPRRFGKTLNMDMLRTFFEKTGQDTSVYFQDKKIWKCGAKYQNYQGKYPVIFITFKDVKFNTWAETLESLKDLFSKEARRHLELQDSDKCDSYDIKSFNALLSGDVTEVELSNALLNLSQMLHKHHSIAPIIIIDEYDTPIQQGYSCGFYDQVILFMRNLFSGGLKDNKHLSYGFLTGILRVAKESIFSGLNNLKINSILDEKYSEYFGFTPEEVKEMADYYDAGDRYAEICEWYDGYRFGNSDIFNPWSVINYCKPKAFWQATGSNDIIGEILENADDEIYKRLHSLVQGQSILTYIDTDVIYPQIRNNPSSIYSFLLVAGYLKIIRSEISFSGDFMCEVALPNKEIAFVYNKEILQKLTNIIPQSLAIPIQEAIYSGNSDKLKGLLEKLLLQSASCYDTVGENFYHGLMLGLCALLSGYYATSNRESGNGRYDIQLFPKNNRLPGVIIELKAGKDCSDTALNVLSKAALQQIIDKNYSAELKENGVPVIYQYGVAFCGKNVEVTVGEV